MKRKVSKDTRQDPLRFRRLDELGRWFALSIFGARVGRHVSRQEEKGRHGDRVVLRKEFQPKRGRIGKRNEMSKDNHDAQNETHRIKGRNSHLFGWRSCRLGSGSRSTPSRLHACFCRIGITNVVDVAVVAVVVTLQDRQWLSLSLSMMMMDVVVAVRNNSRERSSSGLGHKRR